MVAANRAQRRAAAKIERQTGGVLVDEGALRGLAEAQRFFIAIVKEQGRVRVATETLANLSEGDRITMKREGEHVFLSYVPATKEPEGAPG